MPSNTEHVGIIVDINAGKNGLLDSATKIKNVFKNIKLPDDVGRKLTKSFDNVEKSVEKANKAMASGDSKAIAKYTKEAEHAMQSFMQEAERAGKHIKSENYKFIDDKAYTDAKQKLADLKKQREEIFRQRGGDSKNTFIQTATDLQKALRDDVGTKGAKTAANNVQSMIDAAAAGNFEKVATHYKEVTDYVDKFGKKLTETKQKALGLDTKTGLFDNFKKGYEDATKSAASFNTQIEEQENLVNNMRMDQLNKTVEELYNNLNLADGALDRFGDESHGAEKAAKDMEKLNRDLDSIRSRVENFFGLDRVFDIVRRGAQEAFRTVEALDKSMTQTAVVTNFRVSDMWEALPEYTKTANQLGSTIKDVYDASTLYYQQGLGTQATMELSVETLKMARIAGMDAAQATDMMTAALRGFNMELNQTDAQRVNDVYSKLAAITAADTQEIATAMTKVASLAHSAGMEFETTSAFLSQIIETTREAPETAGTALKTVVARFGEIKQLMSTDQLIGQDEEGETIFVNKIDKALGAAGLSLKKFAAGQEGLDDVLLKLAERWDTLDTSTQRYIATMAAGSRQQSRFLALMSDYGRTVQLVDAAYNSNGASQKQYEKTLESLESMMNKLKNAGNEFVMGFLNSDLIKQGIDTLTNLVTVINKVVDAIAKIAPKNLEGLTKSLITAGTAWTAFTKVGPVATGAITNMGALLMGKKTYTNAKGEEVEVKGVRDYLGSLRQRAERGSVNLNRNTDVVKGINYNFGPVAPRTPGFFSGFGQLGKLSISKSILAQNQEVGHGVVDVVQSQYLIALQRLKQATSEPDIAAAKAELKQAEEQVINYYGEDIAKNLRTLRYNATSYNENTITPTGKKLNKKEEDSHLGVIFQDTDRTNQALDKASKEVLDTGSSFGNAAVKVQQFGGALQMVGSTLTQINPLLAPLGTGLMLIGSVITGVGAAMTTLQGVVEGLRIATAKQIVSNFELTASEIIYVAVKEGVTAAEAKDILMKRVLAATTEEVGFASIFATGATKALTGALNFLAAHPVIATLLVISALLVAIDAATVSTGEAMKHAAAGVAAAEEAANNANSAYEELNNSLEQIKNNQDAFDGLTAGTAKWEEQLIRNNQELLDLISNYSELQDYVVEGPGGRLELTAAGQARATELGQNRVSQASAVQTLANLESRELELDKEIREKTSQLNSLKPQQTGRLSEAQGKLTLTPEEQKQINELQNSVNLLQQQQSNIGRMATENAFRTIFSNTKTFDNKQAIIGYAAQKYDSDSYTQNLVLGPSEKKKVLDYYGYTEVGKDRYKDSSGKEVSMDKEAIKNLYTKIAQIEDAQANADKWDIYISDMNEQLAASVEKLNTSDELKASEISNAFGKILTKSGTVNADLLSQLVDTDSKILEDFVTDLDQEQMDFIAGHENTTKEEVIAVLRENAQAMRAADIDNAKNIAAALTQTEALTAERFDDNQQFIFDKYMKQVEDLSANQRSEISKNLERFSQEGSWGPDAGIIYTKRYMEALEKEGKEGAKVFSKAFGEDFDPTSALSSAKAINRLKNSTSKVAKATAKEFEENFGDSFNLSAQTKEVLASGEFNDAYNTMMKDLGDDATITAANVMELAESSSTLRQYLDQTGVSAASFATILQDMDISEVTESIMLLTKHLGKASSVFESAHAKIEKFDAGIDTGESSDFLTDNASKAKEFISNREWGNQQLQTILQRTFSDYDKIFKQYHGNLKNVAKYYKGRLNKLSQEEDSIPKYLASRQKKIDKVLNKNEYEIVNGKFQITKELATQGTDAVKKKLMEIGNFTEEMADQVLATLMNKSGTLQKWLTQGDIRAGFTTYRKEARTNATDQEGNRLTFMTGTTAGTFASRADMSKNKAIRKAKQNEIIYIETSKERQSDKYGAGDLKGYENVVNQIVSKVNKRNGKPVDADNYGANLAQLPQMFGAINEKGGININKMMGQLGLVGMNENAQLKVLRDEVKSGKSLYTSAGTKIELTGKESLAEMRQIFDEAQQYDKWKRMGAALYDGWYGKMSGTYDPLNNPKTLSDTSTNPTTSKGGKGGKGDKNDDVTTDTSDITKLTPGEQKVKQFLVNMFGVLSGSTPINTPTGGGGLKNTGKPFAGKTVTDFSNPYGYTTSYIPGQGYTTTTPSTKQTKQTVTTKDLNTKKVEKTATDAASIIKQAEAKAKSAIKAKQPKTELGALKQIIGILQKISASITPKDQATDQKPSTKMGGFNVGQTFGSVSGIPGQPGGVVQPQTVKQEKTEEIKTVKNITENVTKTTATIDSASIKAVQDAKRKISKDKIKLQVDNGSAKKSIKDTTKLIDKLTKKAKKVKVKAEGAPDVKKLADAINKVKKKTVKVRADVGNSIRKVNNLADAINDLDSKNISISATVSATMDSGSNTLTLSVTGKKSAELTLNAMGRNNTFPSTFLPGFGSAARGIQGKLGPRGKGGKTLVGELGPELAWIPTQNSSVLLGAKGPQVVNLPKDAVVYTADQTKEILKNKKQKDFGSAASGKSPKYGSKAYIKNRNAVVKQSGYDQGQNNYSRLEIEISDKQSKYNQMSNDPLKYAAKELQANLKVQLKLLQEQLKAAKDMRKSRDNAVKNLSKAKKAGTATVSVKTAADKKGKKTKDNKQTIDLGSYIATDKSGNYVVDSAKIKTLYDKSYKKAYASAKKQHMSEQKARKFAEEQAKATTKQAKKAINERIQNTLSEQSTAHSNVNSIEEAIVNTQKQLEELQKVKNEYDAIWRAQQKITALENKRNILARQYSTMLSEQVFGHEELFKLIKDQQTTYQNTVNQQRNIMDESVRQINDIAGQQVAPGYTVGSFVDMKGIFADPSNAVINTLEKLDTAVQHNELTPEQYSLLSQYIQDLQTYASNYNNAVNGIHDIRDGLTELMKTGQQESINLESRILDGIKTIRQRVIDNLNTLNDTINNTLNKLTDQVQKHLSSIRQANENAKTEQTLLDKQQRLAMLQMDTGNGNAVEIAALQKEIADEQQSYLENLQDQSLQNIQDQNEEAANQRQKQIELLTKQLEYQEKTGQLAAETNAMMQMVSTAEGQEAIRDLLTSAESTFVQTFFTQQNWVEDFTTALNQSQVYKDILDMKTLLEDSTNVLSDWLKYVLAGNKVTPEEYEQIKNSGYSPESADEPTNETIEDPYDSAIGRIAAAAKGGAPASQEDRQLIRGRAQSGNAADFNDMAQRLKSQGLSVSQIKEYTGATDRQMVSAIDKNGAPLFSNADLLSLGGTIIDTMTSGGKAQGERLVQNNQLRKVGAQINADTEYGGTALAIQSINSSKGTANLVNGTSKGLVKVYKVKLSDIKDGMDVKKKTIGKATVYDPSTAAGAAKIGKGLKSSHPNVRNEYASGVRRALAIGKKVNMKKIKEGFGGDSKDLHKTLAGSLTKTLETKNAPVGTGKKTVQAYVGQAGELIYADTSLGKQGGIQTMDPATWKKGKTYEVGKKSFNDFAKTGHAQWTNQIFSQLLGRLLNAKVLSDQEYEKLKVKFKYATGGLNTTTGPAWLDGTPSRPELVLNAKDTQNFLQLKDVLSHVMSGATTTNNSALAQYEININVDKIANDYDVERMTDQVIRKITQAGGYKKVTRGTFR